MATFAESVDLRELAGDVIFREIRRVFDEADHERLARRTLDGLLTDEQYAEIGELIQTAHIDMTIGWLAEGKVQSGAEENPRA